jgi:8-oxo-dGTP pyrophosphatase MutT (NUDIX family)
MTLAPQGSGLSRDDPRPRPAARVLLLDPDGRLLLIRTSPAPESPVYYWMTPGGEQHAGETPEETAARELREETGFDAPIGPCVWFRAFTWFFPGNARRPPAWFLTTEHFFVARAPAGPPPPRPASDGDDEMVELGEARWWSLDDLRATVEPLSPTGLVELLEPIVRGEVPPEPIRIGR